MAAERDRIRDAIKRSLFNKVGADGVLEESYVEHLQIFETDQGGIKSRFVLLSRTKDGAGLIHKSKQNNNGTFSIGKTWKLLELRGAEVLGPLAFNITLSRTYGWRTQDETEQLNFIHALVNLFRELTNGRTPLQLVGITVPNRATGSRPRATEENGYPSRSGTPVGSVVSSRRRVDQFSPGSPPTRGVPSQPRVVSPLPPASTFSQSAASSPPKGQSRSRPSSPGVSSSRARRAGSPARNRPMSPSANSAAGDVQTPIPQRPSNSVYSALSSRYSSSTTATVPTIMSPPPDGGSRFGAESRHVRKQPSQNPGRSSRPSLEIPLPGNHIHPQGVSHIPSPISAYGSESQSVSRNRPASPAPSSSSRKSQGKQATRNPTPPTPPQVDRTISQPRRDPNARISFFDPANQAVIDRLLSTTVTTEDGTEIEEETAQATLTNIEEMLEGYEWASEDMMSKKRAKGAADMVESRLLDELLALDKANIHSFLEADDRINTVLKFIDDAVAELDTMDSLVSSYKIHLNAVNDDISFIQSQNRGLQVQTQNQVALLGELEKLLQTVHVNRETLVALTQESLEKSQSIQRLEEASGELYKALLAGRDNDMAATMERLDEYRTHNQQFCKRMLDFLTIMFTAQSNILLRSNGGIEKGSNGRPALINHQEIESYLGRYSGLMLYLKEMDEDKYAKVCATYFSAASELHSKQMKTLFGVYTSLLKKSPEEDVEHGFGPTPTSAGFRSAGLRRNGTLRTDGKIKEKRDGGNLSPPEALSIIFEQSASQVSREGEFIADFLQINDAALTYADYLGLDQYFRSQASRSSGLSSSTAKLVRGAMDLIFGFFPPEFKTWVDSVLGSDHLQIIGIMACVERAIVDAEERGNSFFGRLLDKQQQRLKSVFDRHVDEQVKSVEETKLTSKKRKGVAHFIKYFPIYVSRVESQLVGADTLEIRNSVDAAYDRIVQSMFDSLKQMAKLDGEGEDKGQLNYHVILIENMHFFVAEIQQQDIPAVNSFRKRAETIYDESLGAYVKLVLRRPFSKIIDFFEGVERLLRNAAPSEVSKNSNYNRSSLKRVVKEYTTKDIRKHVDALFKRVEKHYTEASDNATTESSSGITPGTVLVGVWKTCEEELIRITNLFSQRITQCYGDTNVSLEYSVADVEAAFKRHRVGS